MEQSFWLVRFTQKQGMRSGEACGLLKWTDIDFEQRSIRVTPEKGSNLRILPISVKFSKMLSSLTKMKTTYLVLTPI